MLSLSDTHHQGKIPPSPPPPLPSFAPQPPSDTPHSDSGRSLSSSSSSEIMGTPFDLGAQPFEYPFPPAQGSPTDPFLPLSSCVTSHSHSHAQLPPWPIHISKSFPLSQPPLGRFKAHPKLRSANVREPPVPPGLVKRRGRIPSIKHQSSSEDPGDKSDVSDEIARALRSSRILLGFTEVVPRKLPQTDGATFNRPEIVPVKQAISLPIGPFVPPPVEIPPAPAAYDAGLAEGAPRPPVVSASAYNCRHAT